MATWAETGHVSGQSSGLLQIASLELDSREIIGMTQESAVSPVGVPSTEWTEKPVGYLVHPVVDFLCLGGGSLIVLIPLLLFRPAEASVPVLAGISIAIANVINHPNFAHSYQIFYRNFRIKAFGQDYRPRLRARYVLAGIFVPIALIAFFAISIASGDAELLGFGANIMLFLVGWHYVKQGYGMIIVDSVLKRQFFTHSEKKVLLINSYAYGITYWVLANYIVSERNYWGLKFYMFPFPSFIVYAIVGIASVTTAIMLYTLARKWMTNKKNLPANGVIAYLMTLYMWLFLRLDPVVVFVIPAFHSLQYLVVVWRYKLKAERDRADAGERPRLMVRGLAVPSKAVLRFTVFILVGICLGYIGFWWIPLYLDSVVLYDRETFGATLFLFMFWIFINVHHYFLDNVMWRRENPDTGKYLFSHG
ncbi:MAG: hypothetical protein O7C66_07480 [Alphaproteobacteria bacterium]|nr:hypothetical protein [Alphaproteobacteria bacterium]